VTDERLAELERVSRDNYHQFVRDMVREMVNEIKALREDKARLDWWLANHHMTIAGGKSGFVVWDQSNGLTVAGKGENARAAIDAARQKAGDKQHPTGSTHKQKENM